MKKYDLVVVGAGPAGIFAAIEVAEQGKKVLLLEKNKKIGKKLL
ncbi:MAG: FAD-dependent oxidoreductase, partial [Fusobacteriaceae bacterium]